MTTKTMITLTMMMIKTTVSEVDLMMVESKIYKNFKREGRYELQSNDNE